MLARGGRQAFSDADHCCTVFVPFFVADPGCYLNTQYSQLNDSISSQTPLNLDAKLRQHLSQYSIRKPHEVAGGVSLVGRCTLDSSSLPLS